jgi:hypothetical protein
MAQIDLTLLGLTLLEKDTNGDVMLTWNYLTFASGPEYETLIKSHSLISNGTRNQSFSKFKDKWIYMITQDGLERNPRVVYFTLTLFATEFNPEKYFALSELLVKIYQKTNNPALMLNCFLDVTTTTQNESKDESGAVIGSFNGADYNNNNHLLASPLLEVVKMFEANAWMIWIALLMKKRIVIYSESLPNLQKFIRALPLFVLHRQDWSLLRPFVIMENDFEIADLKATGVFVAGFVAPQIKTKEDFYDLFIDLTAQEITIPSHAEDDFSQTPFHQECIKLLTSAIEAEGITDQKLIKAIKTKTTELISKLNQLKTQNEGDDKPYVSYSSLSNRGLNPSVENFLYAVASAEGMTKVV